MLGLSPLELAVIVLLVVVLFGAKRLPELGSGLGRAISNFKKGYRESTELDVTPGSESDKSREKIDSGASSQKDPNSQKESK